jgi:hypothetical protein
MKSRLGMVGLSGRPGLSSQKQNRAAGTTTKNNAEGDTYTPILLTHPSYLHLRSTECTTSYRMAEGRWPMAHGAFNPA